jgi:hypothetical protein
MVQYCIIRKHVYLVLEYNYIKLLIEGKTEKHHDGNRALLRLLTPELVKRLHFQTFLDKIYENELLNERDKSFVQAKFGSSGEYEAIKDALDYVGKQKQKEDWNEILIQIFEELGLWDIADLFEFIKPKEQNLPVQGIVLISQ